MYPYHRIKKAISNSHLSNDGCDDEHPNQVAESLKHELKWVLRPSLHLLSVINGGHGEGGPVEAAEVAGGVGGGGKGRGKKCNACVIVRKME